MVMNNKLNIVLVILGMKMKLNVIVLLEIMK